jgi:hypothetical protein
MALTEKGYSRKVYNLLEKADGNRTIDTFKSLEIIPVLFKPVK